MKFFTTDPIWCIRIQALIIHLNTFSFKRITIAHKNTLLTGLSSKEGTYHIGYDIFYKVLNSIDYGVPHIRQRIFIVGFRGDLHVQKNDFK
ncbi:DNA cytosine methyltransferase [Lactobacillus iners]|uniref:DNA cytosine methyltransferase n=1 Tax=Bacillota TaxID=1239 RepID=UPI0009B652DE|nr:MULTISPECIES: DNA cytosine methyltransferase [Bacillota]